MSAVVEHIPDRDWRRVVVGLVLRSMLTVVGNAFAGLVLFAFVMLLTEVVFVDGGWIRAGYPLYLLLGVLVGANLGLATVLRREARRATESSAGLLGLLVDRAVGELAIPEGGVETKRLEALISFEELKPTSGGLVARALAGFAMARALQSAGVRALREQMLRAVREAELQGEEVVTRDALREAARNGLAVAFAEQLDLGWRANARLTRITSALALVSLPALAVIFG